MPPFKLAQIAVSLAFIPGPPVVNVVYEPIDASINGDGALVSAYADQGTNTIHLPVGGAHPFVRAHEVGHLFDSQVLTDGDRRFFQRIMGAPAGPWSYVDTGEVNGYLSPAEWFADYYGAAAAGLTIDRGHSPPGSYALITEKRMRRFQNAMARLGKRRALRQYRGPRVPIRRDIAERRSRSR